MDTRALPSAKQELSEQLTQLPSNLAPEEWLHSPAGQILQAVASNSSVQVPAGHATHESTPVKALYFPGAQGMQTLTLAWPTAGW